MSKPVLDEVLRRLERLPESVGVYKKTPAGGVLRQHSCAAPYADCDTCDLLFGISGIVEWARLEVVRQRLIFGEAKGPTP